MDINHIYIRYGRAVALYQKTLNIDCVIDPLILQDVMKAGQNTFRIEPQTVEGVLAQYKYSGIEKGNTEKGVFLSSHIVCKDISATNTWKRIAELQKDYLCEPSKHEEAKMSNIPLTGEYSFFNYDKGTIGRGKPKASREQQAYGMITTLTPLKPAIQLKGENYCILPDLPVDELVEFIAIFDKMRHQRLDSGAMYGRFVTKGKKYSRPQIYGGNFPNAPKSRTMCAIALLGAIGEFAKEGEYSERAERVLESLKGCTLYLIKYGSAQPFAYNSHVVELAKEHRLSSIVDSLYYSKLYKALKRKENDEDYDHFDLYASRFLQQFTRPYFQDFISLKATYPSDTKPLFTTYFNKMESLSQEVISSAATFGWWLNRTAYFVAKKEIDTTREVSEDEKNNLLFQIKAKILVEFESTIYSAKTADELLAYVATRTGRIAKGDIPSEAKLFIEQVLSGDIELSVAKNVLIVFLRLNPKKKDGTTYESEDNIDEQYDIEE
ncbi:hypothetical protein IX339_001816 [Porphyromonas levii]|uniref:type I-PGING CRISPR-associated protein Cas8c/Csp2 n=1 Tax=Porphyromonas levii TaxID=28114 RepID=UPI001B8CE4A6|nr:type I-PGING CRISPR-associated protein Cas8c/Csp2 [Porphyromonas levii]MBR8732347.1 hypothetical protein [Porphyromonas levii]